MIADYKEPKTLICKMRYFILILILFTAIGATVCYSIMRYHTPQPMIIFDSSIGQYPIPIGDKFLHVYVTDNNVLLTIEENK